MGKLESEFAKEYYQRQSRSTANEAAMREAIRDGKITPDMTLREMGEATGLKNAQLVRHYLQRFLKEATNDQS